MSDIADINRTAGHRQPRDRRGCVRHCDLAVRLKFSPDGNDRYDTGEVGGRVLDGTIKPHTRVSACLVWPF